MTHPKQNHMMLLIAQRAKGRQHHAPATVVHAAMYWADQAAIAARGTPITRTTYIKSPLGPRPSEIALMEQEASTQRLMTIEHENTTTKVVTYYTPTAQHDETMFTEPEIDIIELAADRARRGTPDTIAREFQRDPAWNRATFYGHMAQDCSD